MRTSLLVVIALFASRTASAYSDGAAFSRDPSADTAGGGGGIYFTGSPRSHGLDCAVCHVDGPSGTGLVLSALTANERARLFEDGYEPGRVYEIEVAFYGDRLAANDEECANPEQDPCDLNLFAFEILDADGHPAGTLCPVAPNVDAVADGCAPCPVTRAAGTLAASSCSVIVTDGFDANSLRWRNGVTAYSFFWRAPDEDAGLLRAYASGVDGRGPESPDGEVTSFGGDGTVTVSAPLYSPSVREVPGASCRTSGTPDSAAWLLILLAFVRRRR